MAKNSNGPTPQIRVPKTKTPAQLAKKAENERAARERLERLQYMQTLANEARSIGLNGSNDEELVEKLAEYRRDQEARQYIDSVLAVKFWGGTIRRWLNGRLETRSPSDVARFIKGFLNRPQNAPMKAGVEEALAEPAKIAA